MNTKIKKIQISDMRKCFSFWDFENDKEKRNRIEQEIVSGIRTMYAYVLDGEYVAGISMQQLDNDTAYLSYLTVKEDCRNRGIGTEMIKYACKMSKTDGNSYVKLNVDYENFDAKRLYEKLGFAETGINNCNRIEMRITL